MQECQLLCVRDGRCLKWSLQEKELFCWLKEEGGTRNQGIAGVKSGEFGTVQLDLSRLHLEWKVVRESAGDE